MAGFLGETGQDAKLLVCLYPGSMQAVGMRIPAAMHLLRLLERYNWSLSYSARKADRWRKFWPVIHDVERSMVSLFVRRNNDGQFGLPVPLDPLPSVLAACRGERRMISFHSDIEHEFRALLLGFYNSVANAHEIEALIEDCLSEGVKSNGKTILAGVQQWLAGDGKTHALLDVVLRSRLIKTGVSSDVAEGLALRVSGEVLCYLNDKEERITLTTSG